MLLIFIVCLVVLLCVFTYLVPCCNIHHDFHTKAMFRSSPIFCGRAHIIYILFVFVAHSGLQHAPESTPVYLVGSVLLILLVFYVVLLCVFTSLVACCDVCYNCRIKQMFGSSLPPVVSRSALVLSCFCVYLRIY